MHQPFSHIPDVLATAHAKFFFAFNLQQPLAQVMFIAFQANRAPEIHLSYFQALPHVFFNRIN